MLSVQPCQDFLAKFEDIDATKSDITQLSQTAAEEPDDCSPFCICSCCSHAVADRCVFKSVGSESGIAITGSEADTYTNPYTNGFRNSIWQPPKA